MFTMDPVSVQVCGRIVKLYFFDLENAGFSVLMSLFFACLFVDVVRKKNLMWLSLC